MTGSAINQGYEECSPSPVCRERPLQDMVPLLRDLSSLSGSQILNRILEMEDPREFIRKMSFVDFFWLIKKVGEEDCLPILRMASTEQWQYLLDVEIWSKDRLDMARTGVWLKRLVEADCPRLAKWLLGEGEMLASYQFFRTIEVVILDDKDKAYDLPEGFFSLDGVFYVRARDKEYAEAMETLFKVMAREDFDRYQSMLLNLAGVLPAEVEEEMFRLRNVRLAEYGFLPPDEAYSIYVPLQPESLRSPLGRKNYQDSLPEGVYEGLVPLSPLSHVGEENLMTALAKRTADPLFMDRIRVEFAGLCNWILSADGLFQRDLDGLVDTCRKAASYLSLGLERVSGSDLSQAELVLRNNPLVDVFRVGYGMALKLKWEAERWIKDAWFAKNGYDLSLWGEQRGEVLDGLLQKNPRFYVGGGGNRDYKYFERLSEIGQCLKVLRHMMVVDGLLEKLTGLYPVDEEYMQEEGVSFKAMLFNFWARDLLKMPPGFSRIAPEDARKFFEIIRSGTRLPPYLMPGSQERFVDFFAGYASDSHPESLSGLRDALSEIWQEFREEYEWVPADELEARYSRFILVGPTTHPDQS
ncbi:MAG: hypothetical protein JRJ03_10155 [Deltaproteobacteria bacterium]|nr:hypothetical protein [Deltaproteobacteria bacterium]